MAVSKVAITAVGLACVAAAGAGGYLALRQNAPEPTPVTAAAPTTTPADAAPAASTVASTPVQETPANP